ncbi:MAG: hypothetical protein CSA70_00085, partial [Rhodobacterales bacterium]
MRSRLDANASPFLGLALGVEKLPETRSALRVLSDLRIDELLDTFKYAISWAICATLSQSYGEDGNPQVWPLVEDLLGRKIRQPDDRRAVFKAFVQTCRKLGLASDGFERPVQAFQIHAGVSRSQLHHLAKAFIAQERSLGLPDQDDIVLLNRWEDDALHFLDPGIQVLQRPILMDHSAWMAAAYVDWRKDQNALSGKSNYLRSFGEQLKSVFEGAGGTTGRIAAVPRLVWEDERPQLTIPGQSRRFRVFVDGTLYRVRAGRLWPLPHPLPREITWDVEPSGRIQLFQDTRFILFDRNTGRQTELTSRNIKGQARLSSRVATAVLIAKDGFQVDGIASREIAPGLYGADVDLRSGSVMLTCGDQSWHLTGVRRPQISIQSRPIAKAVRGAHLWGPDTEIELDFGSSELLADHTDGKHRTAFVRVEADHCAEEVEIAVDGRGIGVTNVTDLISAAGVSGDCDPVELTLTLLRSSPDSQRISTRFKRKLVVWPGFAQREGLVFRSRNPPGNFIPEESKHVDRDDHGQLCLDRGGGYCEGRLAFRIAGYTRHFLVRPDGLSGVLERIDGTVAPWTLGDAVIKGSTTKCDALVLNASDEGARLKIGGRSVVDPFRNGPTYAIPISTLDGGDIVYLSSTGLPTLVATVESATQPADIAIRSWVGGTRLTIEMPFEIGGVMVNLQTEDGQVDQSAISLDHLPLEKPPQFWLREGS